MLGTHATKLVITAYRSGVASPKTSICALLNTSQVVCWGQCSLGECGTEDTSSVGDDPFEMGDNMTQVSLGTDGSGNNMTALDIFSAPGGSMYILRSDGTLVGMGGNDVGQLGRGDTTSGIGGSVGTTGNNFVPVIFGEPLGSNFTLSEQGWVNEIIHGGNYDATGETGAHCVIYNNRTQVRCWGGASVGAIGIGQTSFNGTSDVGSTNDTMRNVPDVCLPSNYTYWRNLEYGGGKHTESELCLIGRSVIDWVDRLFCYGENGFCQYGLLSELYDLGSTNATCYENSQVSYNTEGIITGAVSTSTVVFVTSMDLSSGIYVYGSNEQGQLGFSNDTNFIAGCPPVTSLQPPDFKVTDVGVNVTEVQTEFRTIINACTDVPTTTGTTGTTGNLFACVQGF